MEKTKLLLELAELMMKVAEDAHVLAESIQKMCRFITEALGEQTKADDVQQVSLEQVRGILAEKSRAGHTEEIRKLLLKYGADKLSGVDPESYQALMEEAEGLGDE